MVCAGALELKYNGMRIARILAGIYAVLCLASLALFAVGTLGLFGVEPDPISAAYAIIAAMPWSLAFGSLYSPTVALVGLLCAMLLNFFLILLLGRIGSRVRRR